MPICYLHTNLKESALKDEAELRIAKTIGEILGKPLDKVVVVIVPGVRIFRHGSTEPACVLNIHSIAVFDAERNHTYSPLLRKLLKDELDLPEERCTIVYQDVDVKFLG